MHAPVARFQLFTVEFYVQLIVQDYKMIIYYVLQNIDDVNKTMDEIDKQTENMELIQDALSAPLGLYCFLGGKESGCP